MVNAIPLDTVHGQGVGLKEKRKRVRKKNGLVQAAAQICNASPASLRFP